MLLEWPDRAAGFLPPDRLDIAFTLGAAGRPRAPQGADHRLRRVRARAPSASRRSAASSIRRGYGQAERRRIQGDASTRSYERLRLGEQRAILMNSPRRPDGPPVRDGKPYSAIAHLAEDIVPFVAHGATGCASAASRRRRSTRPSSPTACSSSRTSAPSRWWPAIRRRRSRSATRRRSTCWSRCTASSCRSAIPVAPHVVHSLPPYDIDAYLIEVELLLDWYLPRLGVTVTDQVARRLSSRCGARRSQVALEAAADLGAARLPFAQPDLAAGARRASRASACSTSRTP